MILAKKQTNKSKQKNLTKWKIWVGQTRKTGFSFFVAKGAQIYHVSSFDLNFLNTLKLEFPNKQTKIINLSRKWGDLSISTSVTPGLICESWLPSC